MPLRRQAHSEQWHFRNRGSVRPPQPIIRNFRNIECRDALIAYDRVEPVLDAAGEPVTRWDGRATKPNSVTGREVPDETSRVPVVRYVNPRPAEWPAADFIVGNPPFIGAGRMREALGDGYVEAVRGVYCDVSESSDFVMYWWNLAAARVRAGQLRRFGFVTTNSIRQTFNRRVLEGHLARREKRSEVGGQRSDTEKKRSVRAASGRRPWPAEIPEQVQALRAALEVAGGPVDAGFLAGRFARANADRVAALLETLVIVGQARKLPDGRYSGRV